MCISPSFLRDQEMKAHIIMKNQSKISEAEGFASSPCRACLTLRMTERHVLDRPRLRIREKCDLRHKGHRAHWHVFLYLYIDVDADMRGVKVGHHLLSSWQHGKLVGGRTHGLIQPIHDLLSGILASNFYLFCDGTYWVSYWYTHCAILQIY